MWNWTQRQIMSWLVQFILGLTIPSEFHLGETDERYMLLAYFHLIIHNLSIENLKQPIPKAIASI